MSRTNIITEATSAATPKKQYAHTFKNKIINMARTKEFSRRRTKDGNVHALVRNINNVNIIKKDNNNNDPLDQGLCESTTTRHAHHDINTTMIGRKFQYVTR